MNQYICVELGIKKLECVMSFCHCHVLFRHVLHTILSLVFLYVLKKMYIILFKWSRILELYQLKLTTHKAFTFKSSKSSIYQSQVSIKVKFFHVWGFFPPLSDIPQEITGYHDLALKCSLCWLFIPLQLHLICLYVNLSNFRRDTMLY